MPVCASGSGRRGRDTGRLFPSIYVVFGLALGWAGAQDEEAEPSAGNPPVVTFGALITGACHKAHRFGGSVVGRGAMRSAAEVFKAGAVWFLESFLGEDNAYTVATFLETVIRFLAEEAANGLNGIAVCVSEILRVTGFDVASMLPRFTPEGVTAMAQWGLVALIDCWMLTIILRLVIFVVRRGLKVVKTLRSLILF